MNYLSQKAKKDKEKLFAVFVDLKKAFDTVNRPKLWKVLEEMSIDKRLVKKFKRIYEETRVLIRGDEGMSTEFWVKKGVRQRCGLSPLLFNLYMVGMNKMFKDKRIGVKIGNERIWSLEYADDLVLLAKNKDAIEDILSTLKRFLKSKDLLLSTEKQNF